MYLVHWEMLLSSSVKDGLLFDSNGDWFVDQSIPYNVRLALFHIFPLYLVLFPSRLA